MNEALLQHIWQYKYLLNQPLFTTNNEELVVLKTGTINTNSGPDFFNAKIKIGNTVWAGNIEIHINSSNWIDHQHQNDPAYHNVILHIVYHNDRPIFNHLNQPIPTLELKNILPQTLITKYNYIQQQKNVIPCESIFNLPEPIITNNWLNRLTVERLENKSNYILQLLQSCNNHWEEVFYKMLAKYFGQKINDEPFLQLAQNLPINILSKHKNQLLQTQSLFLGVAGFLNTKPINNYHYSLYSEFKFLKNKYNLITLDKSVWKFGKTRPANFPTIRILQLAQLIHQSSHLFRKICESASVNDVKNLLTIKSNQQFNYNLIAPKSTNTSAVGINTGITFTNSLIINVVIPVLFNYAKNKNDSLLEDKALNWLLEIKPENNSITRLFNKLNIQTNNAQETQALLQLHNNYCIEKKCLSCAFGNFILFKTNE